MRLQEEADFRAYVVAQTTALRRTAYLMCGDWHQADDLVQTVLMRLYRSWAKVQRSDSRDAYVRQVLVHCLIDERRRSWRRERPFGRLPEAGLHVRDEDVVDHDAGFDVRLATRDTVLTALGKLPARQRATLVLRYWEDMSVEQTAHVLKCSTGTVKSQAARGLAALRVLLLQESAESSLRLLDKEHGR